MKKRKPNPTLTPGELVLARFNAAGISARMLADLIGRHQSRISRLAKPRPQGTGGDIPTDMQRPLLELAREHQIALTPHEVVYGGRV